MKKSLKVERNGVILELQESQLRQLFPNWDEPEEKIRKRIQEKVDSMMKTYNIGDRFNSCLGAIEITDIYISETDKNKHPVYEVKDEKGKLYLTNDQNDLKGWEDPTPFYK